jgi:hypothetical protein
VIIPTSVFTGSETMHPYLDALCGGALIAHRPVWWHQLPCAGGSRR